jgi:hypothetical protein
MTKVLEAIDRAIFEGQDLSHRHHLGASSIGEKCARKLWYDFRWCTTTAHPPQLLRLFERGKLEETRFVTWLTNAGVTVWQDDPATGKQFRFTDYKGHFCGEMDGVGQFDGDTFLLEFKTSNDASFKSLAANGVKEGKFTHYVQMQIYMGMFGLPKALYMAVNKNNDAIYDEIVEFDKECFDKHVAKAIYIIDAPEPPARLSRDPSWFDCKWCDHHALCHKDKVPNVNCRTCAHSTPVENGQWVCENVNALDTAVIPAATLLTGCTAYYRHPME